MACSYLFLVLLLFASVTQLAYATTVPSFFIFGDSTADVGTNSYLPESLARADFPQYGIDFPNSKATGRFSNGLNSADLVAKLMGFNRSPEPYLHLLSQPLGLGKLTYRGVNFASGGSGLLDLTGEIYRKVIPLSEQIKQFITVKSHLTAFKGKEKTEKLISDSVFTLSTGSNDIFGYFASNSTIPPTQFITTLIASYEAAIEALYHVGARKFGIISVPPIGCCPVSRIFNATGGCLQPINDFAQAFHSALNALMLKLTSELPNMKYSLGNTYEMTINFIEHASSFNFVNVDTACCGAGRLNAETPCNATSKLCSKRNQYLFWDLYHPTEAASKIAAKTLYDGGLNFVAPINFRQLAESC